MEPEEQQPPGTGRGAGDAAGAAALSRPARVVVAVAVVAVMAAVAVHLAMVFLHLAPSNTVSKKYGQTVSDYVNPEFEQDWKLFAPNPLQQNIAVHARARVAGQDGGGTTEWVDLSAADARAIHHNVAPSHTQQNELRRAWEFYSGSHDKKGQPVGLRGELSERYVKRIVMQRLGDRLDVDSIQQIQVRSAVRLVAPPSWSRERTERRTNYWTQPWWPVTSADIPGSGSR